MLTVKNVKKSRAGPIAVFDDNLYRAFVNLHCETSFLPGIHPVGLTHLDRKGLVGGIIDLPG
jgi:hypothetical protein